MLLVAVADANLEQMLETDQMETTLQHLLVEVAMVLVKQTKLHFLQYKILVLVVVELDILKAEQLVQMVL
tara:strand:- start:339 stop:548 length:210 start_codon:yes stop_codon:yes gene_type:complete